MSDREAKFFCVFFMFAVSSIGPLPILIGGPLLWPDNLFAYVVCWLYTMGAITIVGTTWQTVSTMIKHHRRSREIRT